MPKWLSKPWRRRIDELGVEPGCPRMSGKWVQVTRLPGREERENGGRKVHLKEFLEFGQKVFELVFSNFLNITP